MGNFPDDDGLRRPRALDRFYDRTVLRASLAGVGMLAALAGCADQAGGLVDVPTSRPTATTVQLDEPGRCPSDTVLLADNDPASGAGAVPPGFDGVLVLRCEVDHTTRSTRKGVERFTVSQWQDPLSPQLLAAFDLPDRDFREDAVACAVARGGTTAIYVVDRADRAVRVLPPTQQPCDDLRDDVEALLPSTGRQADRTFYAEQAAR